MMMDYSKIIDSFKGLRVLIIGDVMLDSYIKGRVDRISPEAPVPIVNVIERIHRLGGAANVALNIKSLEAIPYLCGIIGNYDSSADIIENMLKNNDIRRDGVLRSKDRNTTVKYRIIGNNSQLLRIDEENTHPTTVREKDGLMQRIENILEQEGIDVIIFQDYDKGVITRELIDFVSEIAERKNIPITVDPKKKHFFNYRNASLFKPNLKELKEGLGINFDHKSESELNNAVIRLIDELNLRYAMVTLSEDGIIIGFKDNENNTYITKKQPTEVLSVADVSGAGDTVISVASLCLALELDPEDIIKISNMAAGIVCESVGVVPVDRDMLILRLTNNCKN